MLRAGGEDELLRDAGEKRSPGMRLPLSEVDETATWREFHGRLLGFVRRRVAVEADAEDIVQKVFLQLHRTLPRLRHGDRLGAWLHQAARNAIVDHYRAPARRREVAVGGVAEMEPFSGGAEAGAAAPADAAECLRPMIARLAPADRAALERIELDGMSQREAAALLGQSLTSMKSRVQRARRRLKAALLECCRIALDGRSGVMGCERRPERGASACGAGRETTTCR